MMASSMRGLLHQPSCSSFSRRVLPQARPARCQGIFAPAVPLRSFLGVERRAAITGRGALAATCATQTGAGTFISKTEIPAFIPRQDLMEQLLRWAQFASMDPTEIAKYGLPTKVEPFYKEDGALWGLIISIIRDGEPATELSIRYDDESVDRHEWVGRGADGFPSLEGKVVSVLGRHLEIRKLDMNAVDEVVRACIRNICEDLVSAINKYYAFGSAFSDDST